MVDFICMGLLKLQGAKTDNYKMQKFLPKAGLELTTPTSQSYNRNH